MLRLKKLIRTNAKLTLYKSAILPYSTYGHLTWHFCEMKEKKKARTYSGKSTTRSFPR